MSDYWRLDLPERVILTGVLIVQWTILSLIVMAVLNEHGTVTSDFASDMNLMYLLVSAGIVAPLIGWPIARMLPDAYRWARSRVGDSQ